MEINSIPPKEVNVFWDEYDEKGIGVGGYTDNDIFDPLIKGTILEVGCGRGGRIGRIKTSGKKFALDPALNAIKEASQRFPDVEFVVGDACNLPYSDCEFDFVYSIEVLEHVKDYYKMIEEMYRVTKNGGYIFIQTPNYPAKRIYDFLYWIRGKRSTLKDDYTHITKLFWKQLYDVSSKQGKVVSISTRNIYGENFFRLFKKRGFKQSAVGLSIGQKTIVVIQK